MPPYIFNGIGMTSFFNKTRYCSSSSSKALNGWLTLAGSVITGSALSYYLYSTISYGWLCKKLYRTIRKGDGNESRDGDGNEPDSTSKKSIYESKYYDKYDNLECDDLDEEYVKSLKNNVMYESTPKGGVFMYYDFEMESFLYYCDTKDMPYLFLETVARKYAITYQCKKIVVDMKKEILTAKQKILDNKERQNKGQNTVQNTHTSTPTKTDGSNDTFASFKHYNRKGTGGSKTTDNKKFVLCQHANRYSYKGKVSDFTPIKRDEYKIEKPMDNMNYETFKKLMVKKI